MTHRTARRIWHLVSEAAELGRALSVRDIMRLAGCSAGCVQYNLGKLQALGYVQRGPKGSCRTLRVLIPLVARPVFPPMSGVAAANGTSEGTAPLVPAALEPCSKQGSGVAASPSSPSCGTALGAGVGPASRAGLRPRGQQ